MFHVILEHLHLFTDSASFGGNSPCTRLQDCPHINELVKTKRDSYGVVTLLSLLHCPDRNRQIHVKCLSEEKVKDFIERSDLIPSYDKCGVENLEDKISGGDRTNIDEYPWIALLKYRTNSGKTVYGCHGNLITHRYLLTAAHCVDPSETQKRVQGNVSLVVLAEYDINKPIDCMGDYCITKVEEVMIESFHMHPDFTTTNYMNDIALIRMEREVQYSDFIQPICLPPRDLIAPFDEVLVIAGWGNTENNVMNPIKVEAKFRLREQETCKVNVNLTRKQFCAGSTHNAQTCPGDSGGPLMMRRQIVHSNVFFLIGVDSLGVACIYKTNISIYTKVSSYVEWIVTTIHK